jgi:DNA-binding FrmR family transcriptional regulator
MLDEAHQQAIVTRLNRIEGQVRGIRRMVQEPRLCVEILQQLAAAEAALNRISLAVFRFHVERACPKASTKAIPRRASASRNWSISSTASQSRIFGFLDRHPGISGSATRPTTQHLN